MSLPDWVKRVNYLGHALGGAKHLINLDAEELIATAQATTGLHDFGDDKWKPDYYAILNYLSTVEQWDVLRGLLLKARITTALRTRLLVVDRLKTHPDILQEKIAKPLIIIGMGRTGTSILFELLAQDKQFRPPLGYEVVSPVPPPANTLSGGIDHKQIAQGLMDLVMDIRPALKAIHEYRHDLPVECPELLSAMAIYNLFNAETIDDYPSWVKKVNDEYSHCWHKKLLQLLQHKQSQPRWLLKNPINIHCLEQTFRQYPDARIIHTHRDPLKVIPSALSLGKTAPRRDNEERSLLSMQRLVARKRFGVEKVIQQRQAGLIPATQITDVYFQNLVNDPIVTIREAYQQLGIDFDEKFASKIVHYLKEKPRHKHGKHHYRLEDFGLNKQTITREYQVYMDYYGITPED